MPMKKPPHVGGLIRRQVIEPLGLRACEKITSQANAPMRLLCHE